jgi:hypothetical protein
MGDSRGGLGPGWTGLLFFPLDIGTGDLDVAGARREVGQRKTIVVELGGR